MDTPLVCPKCGGTGIINEVAVSGFGGMNGPICTRCGGRGQIIYTEPGCIGSLLLKLFWFVIVPVIVILVGMSIVRTVVGGDGGPGLSGLRAAPESPATTASGWIVGSCIVDPEGAGTVVPCDQPHQVEVYFLTAIDEPLGAPHPGSERLGDFGRETCRPRFEDYIGRPAGSSALVTRSMGPPEAAWAAGERTVSCLVSAGPDLETSTGSLMGSKR